MCWQVAVALARAKPEAGVDPVGAEVYRVATAKQKQFFKADSVLTRARNLQVGPTKLCIVLKCNIC